MAACGVAQLVSDTRFYSEGTLCDFFSALVAAAEGGDGLDSVRSIETMADPCSSDSMAQAGEREVCEAKEKEDQNDQNSNSLSSCNRIEKSLAVVTATMDDQLLAASSFELISACSVSWLENILVEASLRNRDRLSLLWDLLSQHYEATIQGATLLTYPLERYVIHYFIPFCFLLFYFVLFCFLYFGSLTIYIISL